MNQKALQYLHFALENGLLTSGNFNMRKTRLKQGNYKPSLIETLLIDNFLTEEIQLEKSIANLIELRRKFADAKGNIKNPTQ